MRILCTPCWDRGLRAPATNLDYVEQYGSTPRCDDCSEPTEAWLAAQAREPGGETESEREVREVTRRGGR